MVVRELLGSAEVMQHFKPVSEDLFYLLILIRDKKQNKMVLKRRLSPFEDVSRI
eukprot:CAMPEP_0114581258 /NCGR_PEP_ID=MMETSP0125-20121206/5394_1 /TAXON_ID=485358 ORGANISM="Aristerostoma sp., Strain ATCC 50986" /NCGR_SAMPLE_ID=MMETSP0125 /ASSEMBLY_ACC=CAM_ASM_000245 /LENGTH=53 /DNA_ID=CAMNT_0001773341 /DNA_START=93 /DNA_END=254 /DNA_ORIENTATION=+